MQINVSSEKNVLDSHSVTFEERQKQLEKQAILEEDERKREKNSPFSRWTQFNNEHTKELMRLAMKNPKAHALLYFLVDQMDEYNAVMCSYKVLEEILETTGRTISRMIKVLKDSGFIAILKSGSSNVYAINDSVYWKSWGNNKKYSKFPANIVLSSSEQEESLQNKIKTVKHKEITMGQEK